MTIEEKFEARNDTARTVLITGAAGGIGRATVNLFSDHGWKVIGVDRSSFGAGFPSQGLFIKADISESHDMEAIFNQALGFSDRLDALVNNAAIQIAKPLLETTVEEWDAVMVSNLRAVFLAVKLAHPLFSTAGRGAIVNVSSVHIEFAPDNIRVNAILPGAVDTPMLHAGLSRGHVGAGSLPERLENLASKTVIGRVGKPDEIAHAIYFLADETQSSFMTGQALTIDGGATARLSTE
jgi:NAD(P)-dependent dehydrogenase (short-subunit alcohol dehydrogenase family)